MRQKVPWGSDDIDPDAREAAKEAARRAGMSLGEWLNATISERATKFGVDARGRDSRDLDDDGYDSREAPRHARAATRSASSSARSESRPTQRTTVNETLDEVANRLNRLTRPKASLANQSTSTATRRAAPTNRTTSRTVDTYPESYAPEPYNDVEAIVSAAAAESERRMREGSVKTASALDSVVRWIERADERWGEASRQTNEKISRSEQRWEETLSKLQDRIEITDRNAGEAFRMTAEKLDKADQRWAESTRQTLEQQERQSEIFNKAFGLMTRRLDEIEKRLTEGQQPALKPVWTAMERIEKQISSLNRQDFSKTDEGRAQLERFENTLMTFEQRLADIATRLEKAPPRRTLRTEQVSDAIAEIKAFQEQPQTLEERRQKQLIAQAVAAAQNAVSAQPAAGSAPDDILHGLKFDIAKLASRLDTLNSDPASQDVSVPLMRELALLHDRMQGLASRETVSALEEAVRELGLRLINSRMEGVSQLVVEPIERVYAEVRKLSQSLGANGESDLARDVKAIVKSVEALGVDRFDPQALHDLTHDVSSLKSMVNRYDQTTGLKQLTDQISGLTDQMNAIGHRQIDAQAFAELQSTVEEIRAGLRQKPALRSAKETKDTQVGVPDIIAMFGQQLDGLAAKIDMLANRTPDDTATQVLTARIEQLSQKVEAQPRALSSRFDELTARLSDQLQDFSEAHISDDGAAKRMASHLEALSSRLDQNSEALASQLEARLEAKLETKLEELAARLGSGPITLAAQLDTLAQRLDSSPSELIDRINVLTSQMAASPQDIMARLDELSSRIDTRNDTRPDVLIERIDALSSRLEQTSHTEHHSHDVISRLDELASRIDTRPDDLIARIEQLSARLDSGASAPSPQGDPELHGLLKALVHKIDDTQKPDVGSGALDALEHQIRMIADKLDHAPVAASAIVAPDAFRSLEMSMQDLAQRIDGLRSETLAASEYAAEQAAQRALEGHKTSSAETDPETARALSVVHDTLDKVMGRLSQLETGLHTKASSVSSPPTLTDKSFGFGIPASREKAPEALTLPEEPKEPAASQEQTSSQYKSSSEHYTDTARDELGRDDNIQSLDLADPDTPLDPAHSRQLSARRLVSDDTHARASMDVHAAINRSPDPQDVKASFIAAARRAAQAAAAEINTEDLKGSNKPTSAVAEKLAARLASRQSNTVKVNKLNLNTMGESDIKLPDGQTPSFLAKLKTTVETRRRPLLLGMAAILLALVASQIIGNNDREETTLAEPLYSPDQTTGKEILTGGTASPQKAPITIPEQSIQTPQNIDTPAQKDPAITPEPADKRSQATDTVSQVAQAFSPTPLQQQKPDLHQQRDAVAAVSGSQPIAQTPQGVVAPAHNTQSASLQTGSNDVTGALPKSDQTPLSNVLTTQWPRLNNMKDIGVLPANAGSNKLRKAVLEGDSLAVYELASRLAEGRGAPRDFKLAAKLFEKVANENIAPAQYRIGNMYEKGSGVTRDINLARQWYVKAAENGNAKAMHNLAVLIAEGGGSKPDYTSAVKWFEKAAELGVRDSQYNLAILMARGLGTTQNLSRSYVWFAVAASQGDSDALKKRDEVGARLSPAELATAIGEVERFKPRVLTPLANDISIPAGLYDDKTTIKTPKNERS